MMVLSQPLQLYLKLKILTVKTKNFGGRCKELTCQHLPVCVCVWQGGGELTLFNRLTGPVKKCKHLLANSTNLGSGVVSGNDRVENFKIWRNLSKFCWTTLLVNRFEMLQHELIKFPTQGCVK
jgi:hypothetical protein